MPTIGVVIFNKDKYSKIETLINSYGYKAILITKEHFFEENEVKLDGIMVLGNENIDFPAMCNLVISIKERVNTFIWILYPHDNENERDVFLQLGVNGIVTKIERTNELVMLMRNHFLKVENNVIPAAYEETSDSECYLNEANLSVVIDKNKEVSLTKKEFFLFSTLYKNTSTAVSYEDIYMAVWQDKYEESQQYRIANVVFHLREKIEFAGTSRIMIENVRSKGYKLVL